MVTFSIAITNYTNGLLTGVTLNDTFDTAYLDYHSSSITPAAVDETNGTIQWTGLESSAPGGQFDPDETITLTVTFLGTAATTPPTRAANAASVVARPFGSQSPDDFIMAGPAQDDVEIDPLDTPVQLGRFSARRAGQVVVLEWDTLSEIKTAGFRVWREDGAGAMTLIGPALVVARGHELGGAGYHRGGCTMNAQSCLDPQVTLTQSTTDQAGSCASLDAKLLRHYKTPQLRALANLAKPRKPLSRCAEGSEAKPGGSGHCPRASRTRRWASSVATAQVC